MDPKENNTQTPPTDDQAQQAASQQKADGELVVSHEAELDTSMPGDNSTADTTLPATDPTAIAGDATNPNGSDVMGTDVGNGVPSDSFTPPEAPMTPLAGQPAMSDTPPPPAQPLQPFSQPDQTQQPFPPAAPTPTDPGMAPVAPLDPNAPVMPPVEPGAPGGSVASPKNRVMVLVLILIAAVVILGLGVYALMQL